MISYQWSVISATRPNIISCTEFKLRLGNFSTNARTSSPYSQLRHSSAVLTSNLDSQQLGGIVNWLVLSASNSAVFSLITDDWLLFTEMTLAKSDQIRLD